MTDPARRHRVAILGGGISALTAAYWLTHPRLEGRYEVTVHQLGWRLGGKLASSRQPTGNRNVEHGLHVWFGCYDNAFALLEEVYRDWPRPDRFPFQHAHDAFLPQRYTPVGEVIDGQHTFWHFHWPEAPGTPGDGEEAPEGVEVLGRLAGVILRALERLVDHHDAVPGTAPDVPDEHEDHPLADTPHLSGWLEWIVGELEGGRTDDRLLRWALREVHERLVPRMDPVAAGEVDAHHLRNFLDVGLAVVRGVLDPADGITDDWNLDRIDDREFRQWLTDHGARPEIVDGWSFVRALYDTMFQYEDGDLGRPSYAAGTALRAFLRIALTYKGSVLYLVKAGMGEAVIAPLYELLRQRGVRFEFFHKVTRLDLSDDRDLVQRIHLDVQAAVVPGTEYPAAVTQDDGMVVWPDRPVWSALVDGQRYADAGVDFESKWRQPPPAATQTLTRGTDFDTVVLGISLGGFKLLGGEPGMCDELAAANPAFGAMTEGLGLVPSIAVQLWLDPTLEELGWTTGKPAAVGWTRPNDVWADMTQVLDHESWGADGPRSLHYLCGVLPTDLYAKPADDDDVPAAAHDLARRSTVDQFERHTASLWPRGTRPGSNGLDWELLHDPQDGSGVARLDGQVVRANVTPTECCVGSAADTTRLRLRADESGFANLVLCGAWTRTGLNSSCVEAAVMSGMAAARAIAGHPRNIVGESFLGPAPPGGEDRP